MPLTSCHEGFRCRFGEGSWTYHLSLGEEIRGFRVLGLRFRDACKSAGVGVSSLK